MPRKAKFRPAITRVKLNPEQAVLVCQCYKYGAKFAATQQGYFVYPCNGVDKITDTSTNRWEQDQTSS